MDHRIEIEEHGSRKMVHTTVVGRMSEAERNATALATSRRMREAGVALAIWDIREAPLDYSLIGSHRVVMDLEALGLTRDDSVAVIYRSNGEQHEHAALVARNRGIRNIGYFRELRDGIDWLLSRR